MTYPQLFFSKFTPIALVPTQSHRASLPTSESQSLPSINSSHSALLLLIILSGYTFGPWTDAIISYLVALTGALVLAKKKICYCKHQYQLRKPRNPSSRSLHPLFLSYRDQLIYAHICIPFVDIQFGTVSFPSLPTCHSG